MFALRSPASRVVSIVDLCFFAILAGFSATGCSSSTPVDSDDASGSGTTGVGESTGTGTTETTMTATGGGSTTHGTGSDDPLPEGAYLLPAANCDEAWALMADAAVERMHMVLDWNREQILRQLDEDNCWDDEGGDFEGEGDSGGDDGGGDSGGDDGGSADDASGTNNQVGGVDEADFVKNDLSHIFVLADGKFQVLDAWPPEDMHLVSETELAGEPKKMFVADHRAFVYASLDEVDTVDPAFQGWGAECTYGYDCDFVGDGRQLEITQLDISNLEAPQVIRRTKMNGSFLNARRVGDRIYTLVVFPEIQNIVEGLSYWPEALEGLQSACGEEIPFTAAQIEAQFEALAQRNEALIRATDLEPHLPKIEDEYLDPATGNWISDPSVLSGCENFHISPTADGMNLVVLLATDLAVPSPYLSSAVLGRPGAVYANGSSLYLASRHYKYFMNSGWWFDDDEELLDATTVHRFHLSSGPQDLHYLGSGVVKGRILNQFSMDEHEGDLRMATTTGRLPSLETHNTLSILRNDEGALVEIGRVDDIAPTEDIRSVRFVGDVGYAVTFKKTDPLFVFDLSNPENPTIEGELKIPGFSTYMHPLDDEHLLTIGYDADDQGDFAYFTGIQLQIIDVSNMQDPKLVHKEVIGTRGSTSDAATNHLAFNYYRTRGMLALPMVVCEGQDIFSAQMTFSGLLVYDVDAESGFSQRGGLQSGPVEGEDDNWGACSTWWTQANSKVDRGIFMEDFVYAVSKDLINVASAKSLDRVLAEVEL